MERILNLIMQKFITKEISNEKIDTLNTHGKNDFVTKYNKSIKSAKADLVIVMISAILCLIVVWKSLNGTILYRVNSCILLIILMNYINFILVRSEVKGIIIEYINTLSEDEKILFCEHCKITHKNDKHNNEYYSILGYKLYTQSISEDDEGTTDKEIEENRENEEHDTQNKEDNTESLNTDKEK